MTIRFKFRRPVPAFRNPNEPKSPPERGWRTLRAQPESDRYLLNTTIDELADPENYDAAETVMREVATDVIADLMHLSYRIGVDPELLIESAREHWLFEFEQVRP